MRTRARTMEGWKGLEILHRRKQWLDAIKKFGEALACHPGDKPSKHYLERCQHFIETPSPEEWDGVWVMESK